MWWVSSDCHESKHCHPDEQSEEGSSLPHATITAREDPSLRSG
jgi:hypothetical protein